jgi:hypothetical protein
MGKVSHDDACLECGRFGWRREITGGFPGPKRYVVVLRTLSWLAPEMS